MSQHHELIKNDPRWKAARAETLDRDGYACVVCGVTAAELAAAGLPGLQVDHVLRLEDAPSLAFDVDNLQTLCQPHHADKEREYDAPLRAPWLSPAYPELQHLLADQVLTNAGDATPIL